jgi:uncharacterized protein (DUF1800 family)
LELSLSQKKLFLKKLNAIKMLRNQKKIQHLYWRAGFGLTVSEIETKSNLSMKSAVNELFAKAKTPTLLNAKLGSIDDWETFNKLEKAEKKELRKKGIQSIMKLNALWVKQMTTSENPLLERMTLFWNSHFACTIQLKPYLAENQNNTIRQYALGNFRDLVVAISKDVAMIRFLNNQQNRKDSPNENYARELMELFTIGRGNYTENDVKEAARAFTGWHSTAKDEFRFNKNQHDFGEKTFMGKTGNFDGKEIIDLILENRQTARFIATKVYKYFVNHKINENHIEELTTIFYDANYDIEKLMRAVFESEWFYAPENMGTKIKSPIDLLVGIMKSLEVDFEDYQSVTFIQKVLGQHLFHPPNVAGWSGGKSWIDNATLMVRLNLVNYLFQTADVDITEKPEFEALKNNGATKKIEASISTKELVKIFKEKDDKIIFEEMKTWLIQSEISIKKEDFDNFTFSDSKKNYIESVAMRFMTLPEYQLC